MKNKIKLLSLILMIAFLVTACGSKDLTQGKTAKEIIIESTEKQQNLESFVMDYTMEMTIPIPEMEPMTMVMNGKANVFQKPVMMQMVIETKNPETEEPIIIEQYMETVDETLIMYQHIEDEWYKIVFDDPELAKLMDMDPAKNNELFLKYLKEAKIIGTEKLGNLDTVKIEMIASAEVYNELMEEMGGLGLDQLGTGLTMEILTGLGDLEYTVWVDKATLNMVKASMDLTENMQNIGKLLKESEELPPEALEMFEAMEMSMVYEISKFNQAEKVIIPDEAKEAAELPMF